jgi:hypothetical protein
MNKPRPAKPSDPAHLTLEAWSQGMMVGTLVFMIMLTIANMRRRVLLHKLILIEVRCTAPPPSVCLVNMWFQLIIAVPNGFFIFLEPPTYGWYLSSTATGIIMPWTLHNVVAWIKNKPFLSTTVSRIYIGTIIIAQAYWILEIYANFTYFNGIQAWLFPRTRPYEALCR